MGIGIALASALVILVGPVVLGLAGWMNGRRAASPQRPPHWPSWRPTLVSALLYALAFDLAFFIQELFLVLPKALTPGLRPTLFHNNHSWQGEHPLAPLFQGTGAVATLVTGLACALWLRGRRRGSATVRLFAFWMTYAGVYMALPQVVVGALSPLSDLGMAMGYLQLGPGARAAAALVALAAFPLAALWLLHPLLDLAQAEDHVENPLGRTRFVFRMVTLPALAALPLIVAFRIPRDWIEVLVVPVAVTAAGVPWLQAAAWRARDAAPSRVPAVWSARGPAAAVFLLLLVFQTVLRPGVRFF